MSQLQGECIAGERGKGGPLCGSGEKGPWKQTGADGEEMASRLDRACCWGWCCGGTARGFEVVMVRNWCSTPRVTFLQECISPGIAVKVWIWATADVLVPITTIALRV